MRTSLALRLGLAGFFMAATLALGANPAFAAYTAKVQAGTLKLTGDGASDKLALRAGSPTTLVVDVGDDGTADFTFDRSTFTAVDAEAGGGDDQLRIDQSGGLLTDEAFTLGGGAGDDTLIGASGADTLLGGPGNDFADGNQGADTVSLGSGDDTFNWDPGDGSDAVDGGNGDDRLAFNGSNIGEAIEVAPNGDHVRFTRNVAAIDMDLDGIERIGFRALGGADTVTVDDLAGTDAKTVDVDLNATAGDGDLSADTVIAKGTEDADHVSFSSPDGRPVVSGIGAQTRVTGGEAALDNLVVQTLGGADSASSNVGVTSPIPLHVDGGEGIDTATYSGSPAADTIGIATVGAPQVATFTAGGAVLETATENLLVQGLGGDDTVLGQNGISTSTALTIDGGDGNDTLGGGDGDDLVLGGRGDDHLDGNRGTDTVLGGGGNDTFEWDPGDGSDTLEGQGGSDRLAFNGSNIGEQIDLSANGPRLKLFRNVAAVTQDADGIESVTVETIGGADQVTVNDLAGTAVRTVDVDLNANGGGDDGSADTVIAVGTQDADRIDLSNADGRLVVGGFAAQTRVLGGEAALDTIHVAALGGDDTITSGPLVTGTAPVVFDGAEGTDTARFVGTPGDDQITVARNATFAAAFSPGSALLETTTTDESLLVSGLGGNDTLAGQNGLAGITPVTFDGGDGEDTVLGGDGDDLLLGGKGDDLLDGNRGSDTVVGGAGNDTFQWDPGDGSDTLEGQGGDDTLAFNGSNIGEQIALSANGSRTRLTRDVAAIAMDFAGIEHVGVRLLGGADTLTVGDLTGTDVDTVDADLNAFGGAGDGSADTVVVNGTNKKDVVQVTRSGSQVTVAGLRALTRIVGSEPTLDSLRVQTLDGIDSVSVAPDVADLISTTVDLGAQ